MKDILQDLHFQSTEPGTVPGEMHDHPEYYVPRGPSCFHASRRRLIPRSPDSEYESAVRLYRRCPFWELLGENVSHCRFTGIYDAFGAVQPKDRLKTCGINLRF